MKLIHGRVSFVFGALLHPQCCCVLGIGSGTVFAIAKRSERQPLGNRGCNMRNEEFRLAKMKKKRFFEQILHSVKKKLKIFLLKRRAIAEFRNRKRGKSEFRKSASVGWSGIYLQLQ
jgi:hypothetical protein